ncbi:MAG: ATP-binding protein [Bacteroidota bacterium]
MEQKFKREIRSLEKIFDFISGFSTANRIGDSDVFVIKFVVEEIFTNMVKYNSMSNKDILVSLRRHSNTLSISLIDFDVDPFDLTKTEEVDIHQSLRERKVGGLGLHLVKKMVDKVDYEYKNRESRVTLTKTLEK